MQDSMQYTCNGRYVNNSCGFTIKCGAFVVIMGYEICTKYVAWLPLLHNGKIAYIFFQHSNPLWDQRVPWYSFFDLIDE